MQNDPGSIRAKTIALTVTGTLFLGTISGGLWEKIGSPLFDFSSRVLIKLLDLIFRTYKDSIYAEAAFGFSEASSWVLHQTVLALLPMVYVGVLLKHPWLNERKKKERVDRVRPFIRSRNGFFTVSIATILVFVSCYTSLTRTLYVRGVITYAETAIDRIAPHIDDQTEEELLGQFRSVKSADDYYLFYGSVQKYLTEFNIQDHGKPPL